MQIEPLKFAEFSEDFSESFSANPSLKIRASCFLKAYVNTIDEALANIVELCVIFITGSLRAEQSDSQVLKLAKQSYSQFSFMNYTPRQKLDVSFMVLTVLSQPLQKRADIKVIITSILMTSSRVLQQITDQLVIARLIRLIGYYPSALYFTYIRKCLYLHNTFLIQGLKTFDRIASNQLYLEAFPLMQVVFLGLLDVLDVGEPIFQHLIYENVDSILRKSQELYQGVLWKICQCFCHAVKDMKLNRNKENTIKCLNYMDKLMSTQKNPKYQQILQTAYLEMQKAGLQIPQLQDNFLSIYESLSCKPLILPPQIHNIILHFTQTPKLQSYSSYSQYFILLNRYILKSDNQYILKQVQVCFMEFLASTKLEGEGNFNFGVLPQVCFNFANLVLGGAGGVGGVGGDWQFLEFLAKLLIRREQVRGYFTLYHAWYVFLMLHFYYKNASGVRHFLINKKIHSTFMLTMFNTRLTTKIQRKVAVLAAQEMLICEDDPKLRLQIIKYCIATLNIQKQLYVTKSKNLGRPKRRAVQQMQMEREGEDDEEEEHRSNDNKQKDQDGVLFKGMKHQFDKICEFSMFRQRILSMAELKEINEKTAPGITEILPYEWHKQSIRKVFRAVK